MKESWMYRINKWADTFENADTRKRQRLGWFLCPSGNDSAGYLELMSYGSDGVAAFGVFISICQWSATRGRHQRGEISRNDGRPMSVELLATTIRVPVEVVAKSLPLLCHPDVGWMANENTGKTEHTEQAEKAVPEKSASRLPPVCQSHPKDSPIVKGEGEGEGEGEGKGNDETGVSALADKKLSVPFNAIASDYVAAFGGSVHLTDKRRKAIQQRWRDPWWRENWQAALDRGSHSKFLHGETDRGWKITFDFFLKPDTVAKIIEGAYDDAKGGSNSQSLTSAERRERLNASGFDAIREAAAQQAAAGGNHRGSIPAGTRATLFLEEHGPADTARR
jgi:hypothetical protein